MVPKGRHLGRQNGAKIDPKTRSKFKSEKVASWDRLGSILGRFGGCPGGIFIDFLLVFVLFRVHRRFRCETGPKTVWGRNLVENDAKLGSQNDPKSIPNRSWARLGASWHDQEPAWEDLATSKSDLGSSWSDLCRKQRRPRTCQERSMALKSFCFPFCRPSQERSPQGTWEI